jgi:hypothetical protein
MSSSSVLFSWPLCCFSPLLFRKQTWAVLNRCSQAQRISQCDFMFLCSNLGQLSQSSSASLQGINCWCNLLLILQMEYYCPGVLPLLVLMWVWAFNMCL